MSEPLSEYKVAYLGMGIMGSAMAANLAKAGCQVAVWNRTADSPKVKTAVEAGARACATIADAVKDSDYIFTCVSDIKDVEKVLLGEGGVSSHAHGQALVIDTSTIGSKAVIHIASELQAKGIRFVDAPVTGGDVGAKNGTLVIMVGGADADYAEVQPLLACIGKSATHCGPVGSGQALKLCNQILCAANMLGLSEAYSLAANLNLDLKLLPDVLGNGAGGSWALQTLGPRIAKSDFAPGFRIEDMLKDLRLIEENSEGQLQLAATKLAEQKFELAKQRGGENLGTQAMPLAYSDKIKR